jgi:hypothetical protein
MVLTEQTELMVKTEQTELTVFHVRSKDLQTTLRSLVELDQMQLLSFVTVLTEQMVKTELTELTVKTELTDKTLYHVQ